MKNIVQLGDVATYINGYAFKPSDWSTDGVPIIRIQNLTGNSSQINYFNGEYDSKFEVQSGDVLISWSASLGVYIWHDTKAVLNQHIFKVCFDKVDIDKDFFVYQVENILQKATSQAHGATMRHLTRPIFNSLPFYLPPKDEQIRIARKLALVSSVISKKEKELHKLDELVESRFIELFRECQNRVPLANVCRIITDGTHQPPKFEESGIPFLFVSNIANNELTYETSKYISEEVYEELYRRTPIEVGDILLSIVGSYGHPAIVKTDKKFLFQRHIAYLKPDKELVNSEYLYLFLLSDIAKEQIEKKVKGIAQKTLNLSELKKIWLPLPSIGYQEEISVFMKYVDKSKLAIQKSLDELETLKKSLMQQYFG